MRIAYFSPLNPIQSGISDYSEDLLPHLARYAQIDLFVDGYRLTNEAISKQFPVWDGRKPGTLKRAGSFDAVVYHMGNSPAHAYMLPAMATTPGVVVLHDYLLHHMVVWMAVNRRQAKSYLSSMQREYGEEGVALGRRVLRGQLPEAMFDYPMSEDVIRQSAAMIVHSQHVKNLVENIHPGALVQQVNMGIPPCQRRDPAEARARLGLSQDSFVVASFGHLNPYKRLDSALRAFASFAAEMPNSIYLLVGSPSPNYSVDRMLDLFRLRDRVKLIGYAPGDTFADYVAASDVCINLRYPSAGETSASLLRIMGAGKPVLVSATGWFNELPDDCCIKIDPDECEEELVLEYLLALYQNPELRHALGDNAFDHVAGQHSMDAAARGYADLLERLIAGDKRGPELSTGLSLRKEADNLIPVRGAARTIGIGGGPASLVDAAAKLDPAPPMTAAIKQLPPPESVADLLIAEVAATLAELGFDSSDSLLQDVASSIHSAGLMGSTRRK